MAVIPRTEKNRSAYRRHRAERWLTSTLIALSMTAFLFCVWLHPLTLGSASMEPTFESGGVVLADRLQKFFRTPERTDIVWFRESGDTRVRRIVAMPGEIVSGRNGHVCINGDYLLEEPYTEGETADFETFTVPERHVLCLPDNRTFFTGVNAPSYCLKIDDIRGIVHLKIIPERAFYR